MLVLICTLVSCREDISGRITQGYTTLSGAYSQDIVLSERYSPYLIVGDFGLFEGSTLTIEPGVTVAFDLDDRSTGPRRNIIMEGRIEALGTANLPIEFVPLFDEQDRIPGDWGSIQLLGAGQTSTFKYCRFLFPKTGIHTVSHRVIIENCEFVLADTTDTVAGFGLLSEHTDSVVIRNSVFLRNRAGLVATHSGLHIDSTDFVDNADFGMSLDNCTIHMRACYASSNGRESGGGLRLKNVNGSVLSCELAGNRNNVQWQQTVGDFRMEMSNIVDPKPGGYNVWVAEASIPASMTVNFWGYPAHDTTSIVQTISDTQWVRIWPVADSSFVIR